MVCCVTDHTSHKAERVILEGVRAKELWYIHLAIDYNYPNTRELG